MLNALATSGTTGGIARSADSFWDICLTLLQEHGAVALALVFICFLFWQMIWKVWSASMASKDAEIERLVAERDKYQALVFDRLLTSKMNRPEAKSKED